MLDFGFSEIVLTSAIALIVLGPEKLPKVARQVGNWMGRARAMARQLTEQLEREVDAEDLLKQTRRTNAAQAASSRAGAGQPDAASTVTVPTTVVPTGAAQTTVSSAPAPFDTSYTPPAYTAPAEAPAPSAAPAPPPATPPATAALPSGADWLPTPRDKKSSDD